MKRMTEVKNVQAHVLAGAGESRIVSATLVGDVRVRVDLSKLGEEQGAAAIVARGHRREYLNGAVVIEAFNVRPVDPVGGES